MKHLPLIMLSILVLILGIAFKSVSDHSLANVNKVQGLYIFTDCKPASDYEYLGTIENNLGAFKTPQYEVVRDALIDKLKKEYPDADGAIFYMNTGQKDKADAIKFKD